MHPFSYSFLLCLIRGASSFNSLSPSNLDLLSLGNDLGREEFKGFQISDIRETENRLVNAHRRQFAQIGDSDHRSPTLFPAIFGEMNALNDSFLDVRIRAPDSLAVLAQYAELALRFVERKAGQRKIAGIAILCHQAERFALSCPTDQNGRVRLLDR